MYQVDHFRIHHWENCILINASAPISYLSNPVDKYLLPELIAWYVRPFSSWYCKTLERSDSKLSRSDCDYLVHFFEMVRTVSQATGTQGHECAELTPEKVESESTSSNVSAAYSQVSTPLLRRIVLHTSGSWACSICAVIMLYCLIDSDNYDQGKEKRQERGRRISLLMIR